MLDSGILQQLTEHFSGLEHDYCFVVSPSEHEKQSDLDELLQALAGTSAKLRVERRGESSPAPRFFLEKDGHATGVTFRGVPGGHEFTSLVLSVLNADGKGKLPDASLQERVRRLRGPIELTTYVSLSCTNCPDVVQALNLLALLSNSVRHTMVDGDLAPEEVNQRGVQAVPAVFGGDKLLHVGKGSLAELLERLEEEYGSEPAAVQDTKPKDYDVLVLGGGPAGASAAIYAARKGLKTAVVAQRLGGQVQDTLGIENLIGTKYTEGPRLSADLDQHMRSYPIDLLEHRKVERIELGEAQGSPAVRRVHLSGGEVLQAPTIIVATGARWRELGVPGEKEYLGRGVAFCPHCDGPFYKGRRVAVVGGGNSGVEAAIDLAGICSDVTVVEFADELKADAVLVKNLKQLPNVRVVTGARTTEVEGDGEKVTALLYQERSGEQKTQRIELDGVFVQIGLVPNSAFVKEVLETNRFGEIVVDSHCRTSVPGIYAAGDVTTVPFKQIVVAMGEGSKAALSAFEDRIRA